MDGSRDARALKTTNSTGGGNNERTTSGLLFCLVLFFVCIFFFNNRLYFFSNIIQYLTLDHTHARRGEEGTGGGGGVRGGHPAGEFKLNRKSNPVLITMISLCVSERN